MMVLLKQSKIEVNVEDDSEWNALGIVCCYSRSNILLDVVELLV